MSSIAPPGGADRQGQTGGFGGARARLVTSLLPWGAGAAFAACALNAIWIACIATLEGHGDVGVQASAHPGLFRLSVGSALLLTLTQVPILLATAALAAERGVARAAIGGVLYALYIPINLVGYFAYGRLAPIAHAPEHAGGTSAQVVASIVEIGHPLGLTGSLPILGYGVLGLAWALLATALSGRGRLWSVTLVFLLVSGVLSVLGATGSFVDVQWLVHGCLLGGMVSFPALALLGVAMWKERARRAR